MKFLDPDKPIATCISETCDNCTIGSALKCWANYGSPKIWKYRPGPMTFRVAKAWNIDNKSVQTSLRGD